MRYQMAPRAPDFCMQKVGRLSEWKQIININGTTDRTSKVFITARELERGTTFTRRPQVLLEILRTGYIR
jgi:hypothetical protein